MKYEKSIASQLFVDGTEVITASHKGVEIDIIADSNSLMVVSLQSKNEGLGEAQEALALLKEHFSSKMMLATVPLNDVAKHLFDKLGFQYACEALGL